MQIKFTVAANGDIQTEVLGGDGVNCLKATAPYEAALGDVDDRKMKPEARRQTQAIQQSAQVKQ